MKIAVVIFSLNANQKNMWESVLHSYAMQGVKYSSYILVDCESTDSTVTFAQKYGWEIVLQDRKSFNHGKTRQKIADRLYAENYDIAILATQDVTLMTADTLETLVNNLKQTGAAVAYARQVPVCEQSFDGYFRLRNYPSASLVKDSTSIDQLGLMTPFVSNSLAAWDLKKISIYGGFPETDFGEDMLLGAKFILNGEKISYCAESCCRHEHDSSWREIFMRGVAIGGLHVRNPLLTEKFGRLESCAKISIKISDAMHYFCPLAIKYLGYIVGKWREKIKKQEIFLPLLMVVSFVCGLALCTLNIIPANDTCTRYAPMAQAFAEGNFKFAFHPMYGTLFQALSGSICYLFSLNGFRACQLAALLLWWISIIPIYKIFKCVFDKVIKTYTSSRKRHERCVVEKLAPILNTMTSSQKKHIEINKNHYISPYSTHIGSAYPALAYWSNAVHADAINRKCDILVLNSNEKIPHGFTILFSEKIDNIIYKICVKQGKRL